MQAKHLNQYCLRKTLDVKLLSILFSKTSRLLVVNPLCNHNYESPDLELSVYTIYSFII